MIHQNRVASRINDRHPTAVSRKIIAVVPAYNEERFIGSVVLRVKQHVDCVLVIDDGSTDCTTQIAEDAGAIVIQHEINLGKGKALETGFTEARKYFPTAVITIDADYQHSPEELLIVIKPVLDNEADIVIGSRYLGHSKGVPIQRIIGHWGFTQLTNLLSGTFVTDSQSGFRAFSSKAIDILNFGSKSFSVESEMQFLATDHKLIVVEVPITIKYSDKPKRPVMFHGLIVLNGIVALVSQHRPLLFFTMSGILSILLGSSLGYWVIDSYQASRQLAIGSSLVAIALIIVGSSLITTGFVLHTIRAFRLELKQMLQ